MLNSNIRVDLHIHSKISEYKDGDFVKDSIFSNIDVLLSKLNENKINLFAFSDHNRFDSELFIKTRNYLKTEETQKKYPHVKNILPVVEFDVIFDEGYHKCHVLVVFDSKTDDELFSIQKNIEKKELMDPSASYTKENFEEIIRNINQDVILIAAQRKALDNPKIGGNSLSDSVEDIYDFLKVGYISALEVQKSAVQGMILSNLVDFPKRLSFVSGSDCHDWAVYPKHDKNEDMLDKNYYFTIKAKPNFTGLVMALTSPESRFGRKESVDYQYIKSISLNGKKIELSPGINTIIGENGSGKSTIIYGILDEYKSGKGLYAKKILKENLFSITPNNLQSEMHGIRQSEIIDNNNKGFIFGKEEDYFESIDHTDFENKVREYAETLFNNITKNIELEKSRKKMLNSNFTIDLDLESKKQFYCQIIPEEDFVEDINNHKDRLVEINKIIKNIKKEYELSYYSQRQKEFLKKAFDELTKLRKELIYAYREIESNKKVKNIILAQINTYKTNIDELIGADDKTVRDYNIEKSNFKDVIIKYIKNLSSIKWEEKMLSAKFEGHSIKPHRGYNFIKKAKYVDEDMTGIFFEKVFNKEFRNIEKLKSINDDKGLSDSISGANINNYRDVYKEKVQKVIDEMKKEESFIQKATDNTEIGSTLGERSLVYYDFIVHNDNRKPILIIDQPEDNISNTKILNDLVKKFSLLRDKKQMIIVTHNPILVVNLDADNVIHLENRNGKISHQSGCLESDGIIPLVAKTMDGGIEALERRYKVYGRN